MHNFDKGVAFDPGYSPFVLAFSESIEALKFDLSKYKAMHQKKFRFKALVPTFRKLIDNIISFYTGCLLWAAYIHFKFKDEPKKILNNPFEHKTKEELEGYDFLYEVNYLINYLSQFEKDCKYYLGQSSNLPESYTKLATTYKEFLTINDNFINVTKTDELKLPETFQSIENQNLDEIYSQICNCIKEGKIEKLLDIELS